jgi:hypothetical protein
MSGGQKSWPKHFVEEKHLLPLPGIEPHVFENPAHSLIATPTEQSGLAIQKHSKNC